MSYTWYSHIAQRIEVFNLMLTQEYIESLPAGREMDTLVAIHVMGLECYATKDEWIKAGMPHIQYWSDYLQYPAYWNDDHEQGLCVDTYSEDLPAAWDVIEKMQYDYSFEIRAEGNYLNPNCEIEAKFSGLTDKYVKGSTAPLAICRAALRTIFRNKPEPLPFTDEEVDDG